MKNVGGWTASALLLLVSPVAAQENLSGPSLRAFLFGDVTYSETQEDAPAGFKVGQTVAHANAILSERVVFFSEVSMTAHDTGYSLEVERAILRYEISDAIMVSAGRYHTPVSYWNTAFHHGLWLQESVSRPESVRFGTPFVPVHFVGAMAEGRIPGSPLAYLVGVGNGRAENIVRAGDAGDVNASRAIVVSASMQPTALPGARVGMSAYVDDVPAESGAAADERILSAHAVWNRGSVEVIGEYIRVRHDLGGGAPASSSDGTFVHAGVRLPGRLRVLTPYARWERMNIAEADAVFTGLLSDYDAVLGGVRYDFSDLAALKMEYRSEKIGGGEALGSFFIQASFALPIFGG
jgi:hypothetical protein